MSDHSCFVICPIGEDGSDTRRRSDQVLKHIIRPAAKECGYTAVRADEIDKPGLITSQVIQRVVGDKLVIADLTDMNPNVFYELAIRHAIKKPLVQLIEKGQRIPFDVAGTRTVYVDHRDLDSVDSARIEIVRQIKSFDSGTEEFDTPISVAVQLQGLMQSDNPKDREFAEIISEIADMRVSISKSLELIEGRDIDLLKRLKATIIDMADRGVMRGRGNDLREDMMQISRLSEVVGSTDASERAIAYGYIAQICKDRIPWLSAAANEVFVQCIFGSDSKTRSHEEKFKNMVFQYMRHNNSSFLFGDDKYPTFIFENIMRMLRF